MNKILKLSFVSAISLLSSMDICMANVSSIDNDDQYVSLKHYGQQDARQQSNDKCGKIKYDAIPMQRSAPSQEKRLARHEEPSQQNMIVQYEEPSQEKRLARHEEPQLNQIALLESKNALVDKNFIAKSTDAYTLRQNTILLAALHVICEKYVKYAQQCEKMEKELFKCKEQLRKTNCSIQKTFEEMKLIFGKLQKIPSTRLSEKHLKLKKDLGVSFIKLAVKYENLNNVKEDLHARICYIAPKLQSMTQNLLAKFNPTIQNEKRSVAAKQVQEEIESAKMGVKKKKFIPKK